MDLSLNEEGSSNAEVLEQCRKALQYSVHTGILYTPCVFQSHTRSLSAAAHPRMFNTLFSGVDVVGLSGALMTSAANTSVYVVYCV